MAKERILIVDDDDRHRGFLRTTLEALNYEVREAGDGLEGLEAVLADYPDLILLDLDMPRLDGYATCRHLRSDPRTRLIPIIMVTVLDALPEKLRALECGVDDYLNKPVNTAELTTRVRSLLTLRKYTAELENATAVFETIARVVEERDPYTARHGGRVGDIALRLGRSLGLSDDDLVTLRLGATLHDVGKIGVPDAILLKPGPLITRERELMQQHPLIGAELCSRMRTLQHALSLIRHHHERLDGSGYPDGLQGREIPLGVRILSVADVYDALTSPRRYRSPLPPPKALTLLREEVERGWWDPGVVEAWTDLCGRDGHLESPSVPAAASL